MAFEVPFAGMENKIEMKTSQNFHHKIEEAVGANLENEMVLPNSSEISGIKLSINFIMNGDTTKDF